jgi:8-oxo-dGTP pyrophosphatase MutT (NUDIX family)
LKFLHDLTRKPKNSTTVRFLVPCQTRILKGSRGCTGESGRRNKKTDSAAFLINHQTDGSLNLLNINRFEVFAADHSNFPPIHNHGRSQNDTQARMGLARHGKTGRCAVKWRPLLRDTMTDVWKPSVTVAAVIERDGRFLLVEEETSDGIRFNQPAGHLDPNESLEQAVARETLEEAAYDFVPNALLGMYMSRYVSSRTGMEVTYLRFAFTGELGALHDRPLDHGILRTVWMTREEMLACQEKHRSPLVLRCVDDYLSGKRAPLSLLYTHPDAVGVLHV